MYSVLLLAMSDVNYWSGHEELVQSAMQENLRAYYAEIRGMEETPAVKNQLRDVADACVETVIKAERARSICHMRSAAVFESQRDGQYDLSKYRYFMQQSTLAYQWGDFRRSILWSCLGPFLLNSRSGHPMRPF